MIRAIVGANWGDEGKGKITDMCAARSDIVARFQGGANAGHTIINEYGKFALHQLPSGVFHPTVVNCITGGVALNVEKLRTEIDSVTGRGITFQLKISEKTGILMPYHVLLDLCEEERRDAKSFGSTKSGIAPFYSDKYAKNGIQAWMLYDRGALEESLDFHIERLNVLMEHLYHKPPIDRDSIFAAIDDYAAFLSPYLTDVSALLRRADGEGKEILMEGQLGALKDVDHGIYPYVTSSNTLGSYAAVSAGLSPGRISDVLVVAKAYSSAVGAGAFVTELYGEEGDELRRLGGDAGEYGATTGRPRRVGYFDAVASRYGCAVQGATRVALTALDVLSYLDEVPVCVGYQLDGKVIKDFPNHGMQLRCKPVYEKLPGWKTDIRGVTEWDKLPRQAQDYVRFIEKQIGVPISIVSTGPKREEIIEL